MYPHYYHWGAMAGGASWLGHTVTSAIVHGLIGSLIWQGMRRLTLPEGLLVTIVTIGIIGILMRLRPGRWL